MGKRLGINTCVMHEAKIIYGDITMIISLCSMSFISLCSIDLCTLTYKFGCSVYLQYALRRKTN